MGLSFSMLVSMGLLVVEQPRAKSYTHPEKQLQYGHGSVKCPEALPKSA